MERKVEPKAHPDVIAEDRVRRHTSPAVNLRIDRQAKATVDESVEAGRDAILARLHELDREWDADRALMANFAVLGTVTHELGRRHHRAWMHVFHAQMGFLLMHAIVGWCPPLPVLRRLGFRTAKEIAAERFALMQRLERL
jgi:hypothetical protein